ncbi:MAG: amino acid adenylation domain-containing protein [Nitrospira sp.]
MTEEIRFPEHHGFPSQAALLTDILRWRAEHEADKPAYLYLKDGLAVDDILTYRMLDTRARALAGVLQQYVPAGDRAVLVYSRGLDVVVAFWACLYAGIVAIPAPPPDPVRIRPSLPRLKSIIEDARVTVVLGDADTIGQIQSNRADLGLSEAIPCVDTAAALPQAISTWHESTTNPGTLAYLQYTSGSTSAPKGVMVTHANMAAQARAVASASQAEAESRWLTWLPYFHDYGLVHGVIAPVMLGNSSYLFSPLTFLRRPIRWLEAISAYRITHSGAPNFAYELCAQALRNGKVPDIDLSSWTVASCGAEPVRAATMAAFADRCAPFGFLRSALSPAYGLAEFTLLASLKQPGMNHSCLSLQAAALEAGRIVQEDSSRAGTRIVVGCGVPAGDAKILIVDPQSRLAMPPDHVGEIWLSGASAASGYWRRQEESEETFGARLVDESAGPFLRTGDLGFIQDGELFITGRLKDLIIVRGRNLYPQDIELTAEQAHPSLRATGTAAFSIDVGRGEELIVVQELKRSADTSAVEEIVAAIRQTVAEQHEVHVAQVALIKAGSLPKTSSGKVQRRACRTAFLDKTLSLVHLSTAPEARDPDLSDPMRGVALTDMTRADLEQVVRAILAEQTGLSPDRIDCNAPLAQLGLDSLMINMIRNRFEDRFGVSPSFVQLLSEGSVGTLVDFMWDHRRSGATEQSQVVSEHPASSFACDAPATGLMTRGQARLWFLEQLNPGTTINHLNLGIELRGDLSLSRFQHSLALVAQRHEMLRARFLEEGERVRIQVDPQSTGAFTYVDLSGVSEDKRNAERSRIVHEVTTRPFDLGREPGVRVALLTLAAGVHHVYVTFHRLVADGWSIRLFCRDLGRAYSGGALEPVSVDRSCERIPLSPARRASQLTYWKSKLSDPPSPITLPPDGPLSTGGRFRGRLHVEPVPEEVLAGITRICRERNMTRFMVLYAALSVWLARRSGGSDVVVGSVAANRRRAELEGLFGYFANTVALRLDLSQCSTVLDLWDSARQTVSEAYDHQEIPFDDVVEALQLKREGARFPLFSAMIVAEDDPLPELQIPGLQLGRLPLTVTATEFDLVVMVLNGAHGCELACVYDADLFAPQTVRGWFGQLQAVLRAMVTGPESRWQTLPMMSESERHLVVHEWNTSFEPISDLRCVHDAIELQASRVQDRPAVICGERTVTYRELLADARRVARALRRLGVGVGHRVGLCVARSVDGIAAILGVLKAGAAYVPLDPGSPEGRLRFQVDDAAVPLVITDATCEQLVAGLGKPHVRLDHMLQDGGTAGFTDNAEVPLDSLAYVIYTSGSTGTPKGVEVTHRGLAYSMDARARYYPEAVERFLLTFSLAFDGAVTGIYWTLLQGGCLVIPTETAHRDPRAIGALIQAHGVTHVVWVPSLYEAVLRETSARELETLRVVISAGERLPCELVRAHHLRLPAAALFNEYGPTEATVWSAVYRTRPDEPGPLVPIGRPIANVQLLVLDSYLQPVPVMAQGELYIGGAGLARGYLNRPELTQERFIPHPWKQGERLYRTGDLARWRSDGELEFVGRVDYQVKLRGYRIELGEIETALRACPGVQEAAVLLREDQPGQPRLVAYVQGAADVGTETRTRAALEAQLPAVMVPSVFVWLPDMPKTVGGKLDRRGLPAPATSEGPIHKDALPSTAVEVGLAEIWTTLLHIEKIGLDQNFFHLGGHSLLATQVVARIRERFRVEIPLRMLFDYPTIRRLATALDALRHESTDDTATPVMATGPRTGPLPLSFSQQRMWFMYRLAPEGTAYNMPIATRVAGKLNRKALKWAANEMVRRHEAFRSSFHLEAGGPVQAVQEGVLLPWSEVDLRLFPTEQRETEAARILREEAARPFDLARPPLIRVLLVQLHDDEHVLLLNMHHIIGDQWSFGIIGREFGALYSAACRGAVESSLAPAPQYPDYALWQRRWLTEAIVQRHLVYWKEQLRDVAVLALPTDYPRPQVQRYLGSHRSVRIPDDVMQRLTRLAAECDGTLFMALLAGFQVLLGRYTGQTDVAVGVPIANRTQVATEGIVGTFVNTLVMRNNLLQGLTFRELLANVRRTAVDAYEHQDMPFERLVEELSVKRDLSHSPLVQVLFNVANAPVGNVEFDGLKWEPFHFDGGAAQFDLTLTVDTELTGLATMSYRTDLFNGTTIERMLEQYAQLLRTIADHPDLRHAEYGILTEPERRLMVTDWNATRAEYDLAAGVPRLVRTQAQRRPQAVAVSMSGDEITYAELECRSNQVARYLIRKGVQRGALVGLCVDRSPMMVVGLLGIWKAGAAYVPLDPDYPADRLGYMLEDSASPVIVTTYAISSRLPSDGREIVCLDRDAPSIRQESAAAPEEPSPGDLAYVIYTSGSTGRPKGVEITHGALTNFLHSMAASPGCTEDDVVLAVTTLSFDIAGLELYLPLIVGGRVEVADRRTASDGRLLKKRLDAVQPTIMQATPVTWRMLLDAGWSGAQHMTALCGGEALSRDLADQLAPRVRGLWNMYGPTETTIWSTLARVEREEPEITIGRPIANTQVYILDGALQPVPVGVPGELYIGGTGLARGYRNRPELTAERFIPDPFSRDPAARLYRTGDQARYLPDGRLLHLGRLDHQVKIRGFRIELGEVEAALAAHPQVSEAVVMARPDRLGGRQLAAYLVVETGASLGVGDLRTFLRARLPDYMVPSTVTILDAFPLTANGKVNRLALPDPSLEQAGAQATGVAPRNPLEVQVAALWQQVLGRSEIGIHDDFFEMGGHSLAAVQLFAGLEQVFGKQLPLATLFQAPTIAQLAAVLEREECLTQWSSLVTIQPMGSAVPIFAVPGVGGNVLVFAKLAALMGRDQPFYGLQAIGLDGRQTPLTSIEDIATRYIAEIRSIRPEGPYVIMGTCTGGVIAFEIAQQLKAAGHRVVLMVLESWHPSSYESYRTRPAAGWRRLLQVVAAIPRAVANLLTSPVSEWKGLVRRGLSAVLRIVRAEAAMESQNPEVIFDRVSRATFHAVATYQTTAYAGELLNVIASHRVFGEDVTDTRNTWSLLAQGKVLTIPIPAENSGRLFVSPHVEVVAEVLSQYMAGQIDAEAGMARHLLG